MAARRQVTRTLRVPAPPDVVWRSLAEPGELARWLGTGHGIRLREARDGRLMFWWSPEEADGDASVVEITLLAADGGTRVTVTETALADLLAATSDAATSDAATSDAALAGRRQP
jgi:uncharacterized protein YndB with AHSA1/START domain